MNESPCVTKIMLSHSKSSVINSNRLRGSSEWVRKALWDTQHISVHTSFSLSVMFSHIDTKQTKHKNIVFCFFLNCKSNVSQKFSISPSVWNPWILTFEHFDLSKHTHKQQIGFDLFTFTILSVGFYVCAGNFSCSSFSCLSISSWSFTFMVVSLSNFHLHYSFVLSHTTRSDFSVPPSKNTHQMRLCTTFNKIWMCNAPERHCYLDCLSRLRQCHSPIEWERFVWNQLKCMLCIVNDSLSLFISCVLGFSHKINWATREYMASFNIILLIQLKQTFQLINWR